MEKGLFTVEINKEGALALRRLARLTLPALLISLVIGGLQTASSLYIFLKTSWLSQSGGPARLKLSLSVGYVIVSFVLQAVSLIPYRRFATVVVRSVNRSGFSAFNGAFKLLNLHTVCFLFQSGITVVFMTLRSFTF